MHAMNPARAAAREPPLVWLMLGACAAMVGMAFGAVVNIAVFITPLATEFDWPRGDLSLAYSPVGIGTGVGGILMGHLADRVPIRRLALCGGVVPGVAFLLLSRLECLGFSPLSIPVEVPGVPRARIIDFGQELAARAWHPAGPGGTMADL